MKVDVNLPFAIKVEDYHEFNAIQEVLRDIIPGVKVKEIGFVAPDYIGVIYLGKLSDPDTAKLVAEIKEDSKEDALAV